MTAPAWLVAAWLRFRIRSAQADLQRYVDDEKHAQRQQRVIALAIADFKQELARAGEPPSPTLQGLQ